MTTRIRIAAYGSAGALVAVGAICEAAFSSDFGQMLGFALIGLGFVAVISLVFLEVGLSEDRERAAEQRPLPRRKPLPRPLPKIERSRGHHRRLS